MKNRDNVTTKTLISFREYLLVYPERKPVEPFMIQREDINGNFTHRLGIGILASARTFEYSISPDGTLRAFLKITLHWFIVLMLLILTVGITLVSAFHFLDITAAILENIAKHIFMAVLWIMATITLVFVGIAAYAYFKGKG